MIDIHLRPCSSVTPVRPDGEVTIANGDGLERLIGVRDDSTGNVYFSVHVDFSTVASSSLA